MSNLLNSVLATICFMIGFKSIAETLDPNTKKSENFEALSPGNIERDPPGNWSRLD